MDTQNKHLSAGQRRAVTVQTVVQLAAEQNPSDISTTAIARQMGVTQGALFRHFSSKDAILEAVMDWVAEQLLTRIDHAAAACDSSLAALEAMFMAHVNFVTEHPGVPRMLFGELQRPGMTLPKKIIQKLLGHYSQRLQQRLQAGIDQGELDVGLDIAAASVAFIGALQGLVMQALIAADPARIQSAAPGVFALYRRGIAGSL